MRSVTKQAIREARLKEIKEELLHSEKLKVRRVGHVTDVHPPRVCSAGHGSAWVSKRAAAGGHWRAIGDTLEGAFKLVYELESHLWMGTVTGTEVVERSPHAS